ncbi:MAG TPA: sigma factor, partial [Pirellulaceae bacterium]
MSDSEEAFVPRLDIIETQWSLVQRAHQGTMTSGNDARRSLVLRYSSAIRSYVKAMTRNEQETDEIAQDAVLRLLRGDFAGADPNRGRFRDLLKVAVRNMVRSHWDKEKRRQGVNYDVSLMQDTERESEGDPWLGNWRSNVLDLAWSALEQYQRTHAGSIAYTVLKLRADHPTWNSQELSNALSQALGQEVRPDALRQQLRRARVRFAEFVTQEVAHGLAEPTPDRIQEELICLGIY